LNCFPSASSQVDQINLDSLAAQISTDLPCQHAHIERIKEICGLMGLR